MNIEIQALREACTLLETEREFTLSQLATLLSTLPDWLVQRLQLFPSVTLPSKLSCLEVQLSDLLGKGAVDIEDHYLGLGVPKADVTYKEGQGYLLIDYTTSQSPRLRAEKLEALEGEIRKSGRHNLRGEVRWVPLRHSYIPDRYLHPAVDRWEEFNRLLIRSPLEQQDLFDRLMVGQVVPAVKASVWERAADLAHIKSSEALTGVIQYDLAQHPSVWKDEDPKVLESLRRVLGCALVGDLKHPLMVPLPGVRLRLPTLTEAWQAEDPVTCACLLSCAAPAGLAGHALRIPFGSAPESWEVLHSPGRAAQAEFRYHGAGAVGAQKAALLDPDPKVLYLLFDTEVCTTPGGLSYPKHFSAACGSGWTGYGADLLLRGFMPSDEAEYTSRSLRPATLEAVEEAQALHSQLVADLVSANPGLTPSLSPKLLAASRATEGVEWAGLLSGALRRKEGGPPVQILGTTLFAQLSEQYDIARAVSTLLSEKHTTYRFRVGVSGPGHLLLAVGCGNTVNRMRDCPVSLWTPAVASPKSFSRARCRTVSFSSRLLAWWLRLPYVTICRATQAVQHNLPLAPGHVLADHIGSVVEHICMHLTTRQQDSLVQDQTRYVLAGLMSPDPDLLGPLAKVKDVWVKSPSMVVYWARLCRLQTIAYLTKRGLTPVLHMSQDSPPLVCPPQHSTVLST